MGKFPKGFLVGAATAAHQVEGNNTNNDCWAQEQMKYSSYLEPSLDAVDHYNRFEEDIRLLAEAGLNAYRFSIEWARIEPQEGVFDDSEIEHYRSVIECCKRHGVEPIVTLHHFSSPVWMIRKGGWEAATAPEDFAKYVKYTVKCLGKELKYICTINEANMGIQVAAIAKRYMRMAMEMSKKASDGDSSVQMGMNFEKMIKGRELAAKENLEIFGTETPQSFTNPRTPEGDIIVMKAHQAAKAVIKELYPDIQVGLTLSLHDLQPVSGGEAVAEKEWAEEFTHYLPYIKGDIIVTENGAAVSDDTRRVDFIRRATDGVANCIKNGLPVKGYFCWSLLDNFEWQKGFAMTFGLIAVDRKNGQKRIPKPSLKYFGEIALGK